MDKYMYMSYYFTLNFFWPTFGSQMITYSTEVSHICEATGRQTFFSAFVDEDTFLTSLSLTFY